MTNKLTHLHAEGNEALTEQARTNIINSVQRINLKEVRSVMTIPHGKQYTYLVPAQDGNGDQLVTIKIESVASIQKEIMANATLKE